VSVYQATVDPAERNTSHTLMLELVGTDQAVLDVGCASGYLAEALGKNGCVVSGIEYDEGDAEKARPFLRDLVVADLNTADVADLLPRQSFDVVVFGDVLEHLLNPAQVLKSSLELLRPGGRVVISIPNVAHGAVPLSLQQGRWNYSATGLLDRTHIRFFTLDTLLAMLHDAGLSVTDLRSTVADPLATEIGIDATALPPDAVDWVRHQAYAQSYQFVLSAIVDTDGSAGPEPEVQPAIDVEPMYDIHTEQVELRAQIAHLQEALEQQREHSQQQITALRRQVLTARDHAIGSEATVGRMRAEIQRAQADAHEARRDGELARAELATAINDAAEAQARLAAVLEMRHPFRHAVAVAVGPRAWRLMTAPFRPIRRVYLAARR
jgi:2-polyprenyl-3-methyl-5-hydroxy-6-metoxy-1,4-benzoquinol methylase